MDVLQQINIKTCKATSVLQAPSVSLQIIDLPKALFMCLKRIRLWIKNLYFG